jgi:pimeloyl-ACP methyl ester carboxylesterase
MFERMRESLLDYLVLKPTRNSINCGNARRESVVLNKNQLEFFVQENGNRTDALELLILKFPGTAGRAERSSNFPLPAMPDVNSQIWTWNPPGYGRSEGKAKLTTIAKTALAFWRVARDRVGDDLPIWLVGNSLGCLSALYIASNNNDLRGRVGLILRNPPPLIPVVKRVARKYPFGSRIDSVANHLCDEMNACVTAPRCSSPAIFLQSELDRLVPRYLQDEMIKTYGGDHKRIILHGLEHDGKLKSSHYENINSGISWLRSKTTMVEAIINKNE